MEVSPREAGSSCLEGRVCVSVCVCMGACVQSGSSHPAHCSACHEGPLRWAEHSPWGSRLITAPLGLHLWMGPCQHSGSMEHPSPEKTGWGPSDLRTPQALVEGQRASGREGPLGDSWQPPPPTWSPGSGLPHQPGLCRTPRPVPRLACVSLPTLVLVPQAPP